ncbi:MAG: hypothetical protein KC431_20595 [Myxococcales bacterium]|nr:hypothetical protein [Myxococcales bacterium]
MGGMLLLGPLVYALTLPGPKMAIPAVVAAGEACPEQAAAEPAPTPIIEPAVESEPDPIPEPTPEDLADRSPLLLVHGGMVVLDNEAKSRWARGPLREPPGDPDNIRASKPVALDAIPEHHLAQRGRSVDLYEREGKLCTARIGELRVIAQYVGPSVEGLFDYEEYPDQEALSDAQIRARVWETQPHWLVAELIPEGDCNPDDALWARDSLLPEPLLLTPSSDDNPVSRERAQAFRSSAELADLRERYTAWYEALDAENREYESNWKAMARYNPLEIVSWLDPQGRPQLLQLGFGSDSESCGTGFDARLAALEQVTSEGFVDTGRGAEPVAIFDADLDGRFEYVYIDDVETISVASQTQAWELSVDHDWYCPC